MGFDKQRFSELLNLAKGNRSINKYGRDADVDPGYISRLLRRLIDKAPSADVILKLADKAYNSVTVTELMTAAGYLKHDGKDAYTEAITMHDAIEKEILIAKKSGVDINRETATKMVANRKKYSRGLGDKNIDYIYQAKTLGDALTRLAELDLEYDFDDEVMFKLVRAARKKYGLPKAMYSEPAAHGPRFPGTGVFDEEGDKEGE
ncbi:MAG TPA: hypothetical protein DEF34_03135 [Desulfotomaculum sp.]|nr:hypothetical protein [Desulfotomaculum sp.]